MLLSGGLAAVVALIGFGLTTWLGIRLRFEERLFIGVVSGLVAFGGASFVIFLLVGMGWISVAAGVTLPGIPATLGIVRHRRALLDELRSARSRLSMPSRAPASLRPLAALTVASAAVTTRILALAYQTRRDGIAAGSLAVWGDWAAHLAYGSSFAYGDNRALDLPIAAGHAFRYHFLADFIGSLFTVTGLELTRAMVLSSSLLAIALPPLMFSAVLRIAGSRLTAGLTVILFTLTGGVGAWYFAQDVRSGGWNIVTALPQTYARMPDQNLWVDNTISASLYAQRSTLLGLTLGAAALLLLLASRPGWCRRGFVGAGLLVGATGLAHVHLLFTALALGGLAALCDRRTTWLWFLGPAAMLGLPLALSIQPQTNSMRWLVGWMAPGADQPWIWFWLRNVGLLLPIFAVVSVVGGVPRRIRRLTIPLWLWFIVPNLIAFHPSEWNNTKFFLFWQLGACLVTADLMRRLLTTRGRSLRRVTAIAGAVVAVLALTSAGGLDTVRAMQRSSAIDWVSADDIAAAQWLRRSASPGDRLVYGANNTSAVAALSGVPSLSGYPGWTYDLGLADWAERQSASATILAGGADTDRLVERYGIDYVVIGPRERTEYQASDDFWRSHATLVFDQGDYRIYRVDDSSA